MIMSANIVTGKSIKGLREEHGLSQAELARLANLSQAHIAKIEGEKVDPRLSTINRILSILSGKVEKTTCRDVMTRNIISARFDDSIEKVVGVMRRFAISQLPVFHSKKVVGSVRESTIIRNIHRNPKRLRVKDIVEEGFPIVSAFDSIDIAASLLDFHQAVLVSEKGRTVGIITKSNLLKV